MTTWLELRDWAYREHTRLSDSDFWKDADWHKENPEVFAEWLKSTTDDVDVAVDHYLETGIWGELARDDRVAIYYRLSWATQILALLTHPDAQNKIIVPDPEENNATLRWVMIDLWPIFGLPTVIHYVS
jgi:hypothetical protein